MWDLWGEHHLSLAGGRPLGDSGNPVDSLTRLYMDAVVERHASSEGQVNCFCVGKLEKVSCVPISTLHVDKWFSSVFVVCDFDIFLLAKTKNP